MGALDIGRESLSETADIDLSAPCCRVVAPGTDAEPAGQAQHRKASATR